MNELSKRIITAVLGGAMFIGLLLYNFWSYFFLFFSIGTFILYEFHSLTTKRAYKHFNFLISFSLFLYLSLLWVAYFSNASDALNTLFVLPALCCTILVLFLFLKREKPFEEFSKIIGSLFYIGLPFLLTLQVLLRGLCTATDILCVFILIWTNDSMAYFTGKKIGKHKLFARISPKKTWEGFIGGTLFTLLAGTLIYYYSKQPSWLFWICASLVVSVFSTLGDLVESMIKRSADAKDSGSLLPGHGGFFDRFDGYLICLPFIYLLLHLYTFTL